MTRRAAALFLALLACLAAAPAATLAQATLPDIEDEVMCPSCNVPLNTAEAPQADRQREFIRDLIAEGKGKEEIKAELVAAYGEDVLALPDSGGFGLTAYLVPIALVVALLGGLALLLPRWRRRTRAGTGPGAVAAPALSSADAARLDEDLRRYER